MHGALAELDRLAQVRSGEWLVGDRMTQADITATCVFTFLCDAVDVSQSWRGLPGSLRNRRSMRGVAGI